MSCCTHRPPGRALPRPLKEVEAESVAFVVGFAHGMATDDYSFPYVATWAGERAAAAVIETQARVAGAAKMILEASPAEHGSGGKLPTARDGASGDTSAWPAARWAQPRRRCALSCGAA